jgi:hypothetical protein
VDDFFLMLQKDAGRVQFMQPRLGSRCSIAAEESMDNVNFGSIPSTPHNDTPLATASSNNVSRSYSHSTRKV